MWTFVANRIALILENLLRSKWSQVPTKIQPTSAQEEVQHSLVESKLWSEGPHWLKLDEDQWPNLPDFTLEPSEKRAIRQDKNAAKTQSLVVTSNPIDLIDIRKLSNFDHVVCIRYHVLEFIKRLRTGRYSRPQNLQTEKAFNKDTLKEAKFYLIRVEQMTHMKQEYERLTQNQELPRKSPTNNLSPFSDDEFFVIHIGGRFSQTEYEDDEKFPCLILQGSPRHTVGAAYIELNSARILDNKRKIRSNERSSQIVSNAFVLNQNHNIH